MLSYRVNMGMCRATVSLNSGEKRPGVWGSDPLPQGMEWEIYLGWGFPEHMIVDACHAHAKRHGVAEYAVTYHSGKTETFRA